VAAPEKLGRWRARHHRSLTAAETRWICDALENVPYTDNDDASVPRLWARVESGEVGLFVLPFGMGEGRGEGFCAVTLYELERLADGSLCFVSLATVAVGDGPRRLTDTDGELLEQLARKLGCQSLCLATRRPGLVRKFTRDRAWRVASVTLKKTL
jgi:hypothetical protein